MSDITSLFGCNVFNDSVMRERLPKDTYKALKSCIEGNRRLSDEVAMVVANAMKDWAIEKGATHYTHWFQPMTGITAEKHDAFISAPSEGRIIMEFSGKELIKGESDASSFPSGGLRATFEARGYTTWDPSSYAFVKDGTLYIPTAFCSFSGDVLDKKTPLLRSMEALNRQALRVLHALGKTDVKRVIPNVGPEQEYFLVDLENYRQRRDLLLTGRTLYGAKPARGQEVGAHYYGDLKERVANYMKELDEELWKLGVPSKTKHNEAAPAQHELAQIYASCNLATDQNQLTMIMMKKIAAHHGLACLLHEKPFAGVNGSGKHNNWSISTDQGENLLDPGHTREEKIQFLLFMAAVIKAVDEYADLLLASVCKAGNDHRLGGHEAPPAIISIFMGQEMEDLLEAAEKGEQVKAADSSNLKSGVSILPNLKRDNSDRNRTSPFAFTGNKFEFRMVGSSASIASPNIILNTIVAEELRQFADVLETVEDKAAAVEQLTRETIARHRRVLYMGNNYSEEWREEAKRRGLCGVSSAAEAIPFMIAPKNQELFLRHRVFNETELYSRYEIMVSSYVNTIKIESSVMLRMARENILPAVLRYEKLLMDNLLAKKTCGLDLPLEPEGSLLKDYCAGVRQLKERADALETAMNGSSAPEDSIEQAAYCRAAIVPAMEELRATADTLELLTAHDAWPFPTYEDLMFYI